QRNTKWAFKALQTIRQACFHRDPLELSERETCRQSASDDLEYTDMTKSPLNEKEKDILRSSVALMKITPKAASFEECAKLQYLHKRLIELQEGEKAIVFSQFNDTLSRMTDY